MNKVLIVANWKMNPQTTKQAQDLFAAVEKGVGEIEGAEVVICPPFVYISEILGAASSFARPKTSYGGSSIAFGVGGQDCFWEDRGAFTGEISSAMLKSLGCSHVILGHSERKSNLGETLEMVNKKVKAALLANLIPVVCIGEDIEKEIKNCLPAGDVPKGQKLFLVYEPEWAISTSPNAKPDTPEHAKNAIAQIKKIAGADVPVLYGGSTNSKNIRGFIEAGAQGALVGSASLDAKEFVQLVKSAVSA